MKTLLPILLVAATPAFAQTSAPPPSCDAAAPFVGFEKAAPVAASPSARPLPEIAIGRAAAVTLAPAATLRLVTVPGHAPVPGSFGGIFELRVPAAGVYRIGLDGKVWIDVAQDGKPLESVAHMHGPDCGPVRKIVDFHLGAGTYTLQLSDAVKPGVTVMVAAAQ